jgi:hypothetical protein
MFGWIVEARQCFLPHYTDIGTGYQRAVDLQADHNQFTSNAMVSPCLYYMTFECHGLFSVLHIILLSVLSRYCCCAPQL